MALRDYFVIVDDECGTAHTYHVVESPSPNAAAAFAERIFNAHLSFGGKVKVVFDAAHPIDSYEGKRFSKRDAILLAFNETEQEAV